LRTRATQRMVELRLQLSLLDELETQKATGVSRVTVSSPFAYGLWSVMGGLYDRMNLPNDLLKYLVLARIALPKSKLTTVRYLSDNLRLNTSLSSVYRYMDSLSKDNLMATLLAHAQQRAISRGEQAISVVFYDVTTLYFETDEEDLDSEAAPGLRKKGYSKDHRYDLPQIVKLPEFRTLCLGPQLVSVEALLVFSCAVSRIVSGVLWCFWVVIRTLQKLVESCAVLNEYAQYCSTACAWRSPRSVRPGLQTCPAF